MMKDIKKNNVFSKYKYHLKKKLIMNFKSIIILGLLAFAFAKQFPGLEWLEEGK